MTLLFVLHSRSGQPRYSAREGVLAKLFGSVLVLTTREPDKNSTACEGTLRLVGTILRALSSLVRKKAFVFSQEAGKYQYPCQGVGSVRDVLSSWSSRILQSLARASLTQSSSFQRKRLAGGRADISDDGTHR